MRKIAVDDQRLRRAVCSGSTSDGAQKLLEVELQPVGSCVHLSSVATQLLVSLERSAAEASSKSRHVITELEA